MATPATTYRYTEHLATVREGEQFGYTFRVEQDGQRIATIELGRCTRRTQFYEVTMTDGTKLDGEWASVRRAAHVAAEATTKGGKA